jgi:hypothetical protein
MRYSARHAALLLLTRTQCVYIVKKITSKHRKERKACSIILLKYRAFFTAGGCKNILLLKLVLLEIGKI